MDTETRVEKLDKTENDTNEEWQVVKTETNELNMKQILKPMLVGLALAGCYNFTDTGIWNKSTRTSFLKSATSAVYRVIFLVAILLFLSKCIAACFYLPSENFTFNLQIIFWLTSGVSTFLIYFKCTSKRYGHLTQVFDFWVEEIMPDFKELRIDYPTARMQTQALVILILSLILVLFNTVVTAVQVYLSKENIFLCPFEVNPYTLAVFFVLHVAATLIWSIPFAIAIAFSSFLREAFNAVNQEGKNICTKNSCKLAINFDKLRRLHLKLCKLVSDLDQDLSWFYAASFAFNIGSNTYLLYQIVRISMDSFLLAIYLFWFTGGISVAALIATYAARLHEAAHSPLDTIFYINVQDITVEKLAQLNLFLSKLAGAQVGFSTCGLLIITKEFILTLVGLFLTYFAVLYTL